MSGAHSDVATKMAQGLAYKDQGNEAFMKGDHVGALKAYHYATLYLAGLDVNVLQQLGPVPDRAKGTREDQKQLSLVRSNVCIVSLTRRWQPAIFRKAQALRRQGALYQARDWLDAEAVRPYTHSPDFDAERARIASSIAARERASHARLRGFLT